MVMSKTAQQRSYAGFLGKEGGAPSLPANTVLPTISGTAKVGSTLTATNGTWTGRSAPFIRHQWKAGGVAVTGAINKTYVPVVGDVGKTITVTVTGSNWKGSASVTSTATAAVSA